MGGGERGVQISLLLLRGGDFLGADVIVDRAQRFEAFDFILELHFHRAHGFGDDGGHALRRDFLPGGEHRGEELLAHRALVEEAEDVALFQMRGSHGGIVAAVGHRVIDHDAQRRGREKTIRVQCGGRDAFHDGVDFEENGFAAGVFPDAEGGVALLGAEQQIERATDERMIAAHQSEILAAECARAVERHGHAVCGQRRKCVSEQMAGLQQVCARAEVVHLHAEVIEQAHTEFLESRVAVGGADLRDQCGGASGF